MTPTTMTLGRPIQDAAVNADVEFFAFEEFHILSPGLGILGNGGQTFHQQRDHLRQQQQDGCDVQRTGDDRGDILPGQNGQCGTHQKADEHGIAKEPDFFFQMLRIRVQLVKARDPVIDFVHEFCVGHPENGAGMGKADARGRCAG